MMIFADTHTAFQDDVVSFSVVITKIESKISYKLFVFILIHSLGFSFRDS